MVNSSTGKIPFFAPASIAIFAIVNLSSIESSLIPSPVNSIDLYNAPSTPIIPIICNMTSFPLTYLEGLPIILNLIAEGTLNQHSPVAIPIAISVLPIPVEKAPNAP